VVPHGCIEEGELLLVVAEMGSPGGRFDHAHGGVAIGRLEQGMIGDELVSQDPDQAHDLRLRYPVDSESKNGLFRRGSAKE